MERQPLTTPASGTAPKLYKVPLIAVGAFCLLCYSLAIGFSLRYGFCLTEEGQHLAMPGTVILLLLNAFYIVYTFKIFFCITSPTFPSVTQVQELREPISCLVAGTTVGLVLWAVAYSLYTDYGYIYKPSPNSEGYNLTFSGTEPGHGKRSSGIDPEYNSSSGKELDYTNSSSGIELDLVNGSFGGEDPEDLNSFGMELNVSISGTKSIRHEYNPPFASLFGCSFSFTCTIIIVALTWAFERDCIKMLLEQHKPCCLASAMYPATNRHLLSYTSQATSTDLGHHHHSYATSTDPAHPTSYAASTDPVPLGSRGSITDPALPGSRGSSNSDTIGAISQETNSTDIYTTNGQSTSIHKVHPEIHAVCTQTVHPISHVAHVHSIPSDYQPKSIHHASTGIDTVSRTCQTVSTETHHLTNQAATGCTSPVHRRSQAITGSTSPVHPASQAVTGTASPVHPTSQAITGSASPVHPRGQAIAGSASPVHPRSQVITGSTAGVFPTNQAIVPSVSQAASPDLLSQATTILLRRQAGVLETVDEVDIEMQPMGEEDSEMHPVGEKDMEMKPIKKDIENQPK